MCGIKIPRNAGGVYARGGACLYSTVKYKSVLQHGSTSFSTQICTVSVT